MPVVWRLGIPLQADPRRSSIGIYRDTQFRRDKSPYRVHLGASFPWLETAGGAGDQVDAGAHGAGRRLAYAEVSSPGLPDLLADGHVTALPVFRFLATLRRLTQAESVHALVGDDVRPPEAGSPPGIVEPLQRFRFSWCSDRHERCRHHLELRCRCHDVARSGDVSTDNGPAGQ